MVPTKTDNLVKTYCSGYKDICGYNMLLQLHIYLTIFKLNRWAQLLTQDNFPNDNPNDKQTIT